MNSTRAGASRPSTRAALLGVTAKCMRPRRIRGQTKGGRRPPFERPWDASGAATYAPHETGQAEAEQTQGAGLGHRGGSRLRQGERGAGGTLRILRGEDEAEQVAVG